MLKKSKMKANENLHCYVPCSMEKRNAGQCGCANKVFPHSMKKEKPTMCYCSNERILEEKCTCYDASAINYKDPIICPNCGNNKLVNIAAELNGGYKCIDCGIRFKK